MTIPVSGTTPLCDFFYGHIHGKAEIKRARGGICGGGQELCGTRVDIDLRCAEEECIASVLMSQLHPEDVAVKVQTFLQMPGGENEMVEVGDVHACLLH